MMKATRGDQIKKSGAKENGIRKESARTAPVISKKKTSKTVVVQPTVPVEFPPVVQIGETKNKTAGILRTQELGKDSNEVSQLHPNVTSNEEAIEKKEVEDGEGDVEDEDEVSVESEESYDSFDSNEEVVRKRRKHIYTSETEEEEEEHEEEEEEEEEEIKIRTDSLPDVTLLGHLDKDILRGMSFQELEAALLVIGEEIENLQIENLVYERTVLKMEKREVEIEASLPPFTYKFPWELDGEGKAVEVKAMHPDAVCGDLSDDEPDPPDGIYRPYIPAQDPDIDRDALARMLQVGEESGDADRTVSVTRFLQSFGEIPPANFDVVRHKYGNLVRFAKYAAPPEEGEMGNHGKGSRDPFAVHVPKKDEFEFGVDEEVEESRHDVDVPEIDLSMLISQVMEFEEDPQFPDFNPHDAKTLPIAEKIKYAQIEEESLRTEFLETETKGIQRENSIQVYIDTYMDSYDLSLKMTEAFKAVISSGAHHLTGKMRAEKIMIFRDKLKKRFLEEEAKVNIKLGENRKKKRRMDKQLKFSQDIGGTIQIIDYENLRVQNFEFQSSIEDQQRDLKKLKYVTAEWLQKLEQNRDRLNASLKNRRSLETDISTRGALKTRLNTRIDKYVQNTDLTTAHCTFLKKRILAFSAPSTLAYVNLKSVENHLGEEVEFLRNKVEAMNGTMKNARTTFNRLLTLAPNKDTVRETTETWMAEIKKEVEDHKLMYLLGDGNEVNDSVNDFVLEKRKEKSGVGNTRESMSFPFPPESTNSALYLSGLSQSVTELYQVGKEKKRQDQVRKESGKGGI